MSRLDSVYGFRRIPPKCRLRAGLAGDRCIEAEHGGIAADARCLQNACSSSRGGLQLAPAHDLARRVVPRRWELLA